MKKLNSVVYHKLLLQAGEAKEQGMVKLAAGILDTLGPIPEDEVVTYNFETLQEDIYSGLWKLAVCVMKYHDVGSADASKVDQTLERLASKLIEEVEQSLGVDNTRVGPLENAVPGENK